MHCSLSCNISMPCCPLKNGWERVLLSKVIRPQSNLARRLALQSHSQHSLLLVPQSEHKKDQGWERVCTLLGKNSSYLKLHLLFDVILFYFIFPQHLLHTFSCYNRKEKCPKEMTLTPTCIQPCLRQMCWQPCQQRQHHFLMHHMTKSMVST